MIYVCVFMCGGYICKFLHYAHSELQKKKIINFILPETIASTSSNIQKADKKLFYLVWSRKMFNIIKPKINKMRKKNVALDKSWLISSLNFVETVTETIWSPAQLQFTCNLNKNC